MNNINRLRIRYLLAYMMAALLGYGSQSIAAAPPGPPSPPAFTVDFPSGLACNGFDLRIEGWGGNRHFKEFTDKNGNVVRSLEAGTGSALRYTNLSTNKGFFTKSNGAVAHIRYNSDGSYTQTNTGHTVLILYPTDFPAGPSTTLIAGSLIFTVDSAFNFTVLEENGKKIDICAAVS
jgi:hypothetical protein